MDSSTGRVFPGGGVANAGASMTARDLMTWRPPRRSADGDLLYDQGTLISRSRDIERNSGIAKGGAQTLIDNVVGTGLRLNPQPNYTALGKSKEWADEVSRIIRARWIGYADTTACDAADTLIFDQMTAQVFRAQLHGDATALPLWLPDRGDGWATKIQVFDSDRLSTPSTKTESTRLRAGVQKDEYGAPVGYWVRNTHPGDYMLASDDGVYSWSFVPKYTPFGRRRFIHCFDQERPGQTRGRPVVSSILSNFKGLDRYTAAEIKAAVHQAMIAFTIETPMDQESIEALFRDNPQAYLGERQKHAVTVGDAQMLPLFPGDKLNSFAPTRPASGFAAFQENVGRIIALAYDMPYELLFKDFTKANYSSMRAAMLEAWRAFNRRRDDLGTQWADPVYTLWLEEDINKGSYAGLIEPREFYANVPAFTRCKWIGPGRGWVDPVKEAVAVETRLLTRVSTLEKECAEQGEDWRDVLEQIAVETAYKQKLGIPEVATGRATIVPDNADDAPGVETPGSAPPNSRPSSGGAAINLPEANA
jgi:lambda family phage portal protein